MFFHYGKKAYEANAWLPGEPIHGMPGEEIVLRPPPRDSMPPFTMSGIFVYDPQRAIEAYRAVCDAQGDLPAVSEVWRTRANEKTGWPRSTHARGDLWPWLNALHLYGSHHTTSWGVFRPGEGVFALRSTAIYRVTSIVLRVRRNADAIFPWATTWNYWRLQTPSPEAIAWRIAQHGLIHRNVQ